jgi:hypothetical protein
MAEQMPIIDREVLQRIATTRLEEARALEQSRHYLGAIYLGGYAVECWLKVAICNTLDWPGLYATFKSHDLAYLLLHSGLGRRIEVATTVGESFRKIRGMWPKDRGVELRYHDPSSYGRNQASQFLRWVIDDEVGVVPWLRKQAL